MPAVGAPYSFRTMSDDHGSPIHYTAVQRGTAVYDSEGVKVGEVRRVEDNYREHILDGFEIADNDGTVRFVDAPEVARTFERGVTLSITAEELPELGEAGRSRHRPIGPQRQAATAAACSAASSAAEPLRGPQSLRRSQSSYLIRRDLEDLADRAPLTAAEACQRPQPLDLGVSVDEGVVVDGDQDDATEDDHRGRRSPACPGATHSIATGEPATRGRRHAGARLALEADLGELVEVGREVGRASR